MDRVKYLFDYWDRVAARIRKSPRIFLFFDYDGTLTPIVSQPELAKCSPAIKNLIKRLQEDPEFTVAIISGRSLKDIKKMVGINGIIYAGNHGFEIENGSGRILKPCAISEKYLLKEIRPILQKELRRVKGAWIEDKGYTLSVHFRLAEDRKIPFVKNIFRRITMPYVLSNRIRISSGKKVLEVRPGVNWDKGMAVERLLAGKEKALPIYIGDDITDIDAFHAIEGRGISIFVGRLKKSIKADYFLKNPGDVEKLMEKLIDL